ncbi:proline-, glutamic acid- and leucine-rich protein 1 [Lucilia sericata]|uniref:proline-, glutamic acid- and leucine-rich protein 1 n=1 Tax=Lucilia sericata TaxID=13632 RepID=UPI0018A80AEA|nr:proline-, glutamic acid- and leucine-rich protein 1 [Lucilia sericata]
MESYLSIFQGILSTEGTFLDIYLDGLDHHSKFGIQSNEGAEIVQNISSLLTKSTTRSLGLRLLTKYIDHCPIEVFEKKGNLWITLVLKACNSQELNCDALIFEVLGKIIKRSLHSPDLAKSFASTHISKVYENLTKVSQFQVKYALSCIETCLRTYPGSSGPSKGVIERFLWKNVDHLDGEVVQNCGKCLHLLQQVKGGGVQGVNHKTQWKNYQLQLMGGIHSVYNEMFSNCVEMYEEKIEQMKLPWEGEQHNFDTEPVKKAAQMYTRCHNMIRYLLIALREPFPVEKPILVKKILNVVIRGLGVNCLMLEQNPIADNIALSILLPKLHVDLFELLKVAVLILRGHLRPYSELILGLIIDAIKWTSSKNAHGDQKTLLVLRKQVYETVSLWCEIFNSGNRCETVAEYLFQEILSDITPTQSEFTLKVLSGARKHMSKKARRQLHNAQNEKSNMAHTHSNDSSRKGHFSEERNKELCIAALRCLQQILLSVSNFIKPTILKMMHTSISQICAILYELPPKTTCLYNNKDCRIEIYNTLYAILMTPHYLCPPPTDMALTIIQTAYARDDSLKVRNRCCFILQNVEKIIHPQKESLLFTIEARDIRNTFIKMGQESLLQEFRYDFNNSSNNNSDVLELNETTSSEFINTSVNNHVHDDNAQDDLEYKNKSQTNVDIISTNTQTLQNHNVNEEDPLKDQPNEDYELEVTMDQVNSNDSLPRAINNSNIVENISKSQDELTINDDTNIATLCVEESNCDLISDEPTSKKQKLDNENEEKNELQTVQTEIISNNVSIMDNEDDLLADIASQFVDELN